MRMKTWLTHFILIFLLLLVTVMLTFIFQQNKQLEEQRELLILKNDSLHIQQLKTRDRLDSVQNDLNIALKQKNKK